LSGDAKKRVKKAETSPGERPGDGSSKGGIAKIGIPGSDECGKE
jgi:hypothetical protein